MSCFSQAGWPRRILAAAVFGFLGGAGHAWSAAPFVVTSAADDGAGTLREAITKANASKKGNRIEFDLPSAPFRIALNSELPQIVSPVIIDGTTQPNGTGTSPILVTSATGVNLNTGFKITAGHSALIGLTVRGFAVGISLTGKGSNRIIGDAIEENGIGVYIESSRNSIVRSSIKGSQLSGIAINGANARTNRVQGNSIIDNRSLGAVNGVEIYGSSNLIGGVLEEDRNVISGNSGYGVVISGSAAAHNRVQGNYIGTDASGVNAKANSLDGIRITEGASKNVIGGPSSLVHDAGNVISGNSVIGVRIDHGATGNQLQGNLIGNKASGNEPLPNSVGVLLLSPNNIIGGASILFRNVISGNTNDGIQIGDGAALASGNTVQGNAIGTDAFGEIAIPNLGSGIVIDRSGDNQIGGRAKDTGNIISGNARYGVVLKGGSTLNNKIEGNEIGRKNFLVGNTIAGVQILGGAAFNVIGGLKKGAGNKIKFNGGGGANPTNQNGGIVVDGGAGAGNAILHNSISTNSHLGIDIGANGADGETASAFVVFEALNHSQGRSEISGTVLSEQPKTYHVEFFSNVQCGFNPQGLTYLGSATVTTKTQPGVDGAFGDFERTTPKVINHVTATVSEIVGGEPVGTSEFSDCVDDFTL